MFHFGLTGEEHMSFAGKAGIDGMMQITRHNSRNITETGAKENHLSSKGG